MTRASSSSGCGRPVPRSSVRRGPTAGAGDTVTVVEERPGPAAATTRRSVGRRGLGATVVERPGRRGLAGARRARRPDGAEPGRASRPSRVPRRAAAAASRCAATSTSGSRPRACRSSRSPARTARARSRRSSPRCSTRPACARVRGGQHRPSAARRGRGAVPTSSSSRSRRSSSTRRRRRSGPRSRCCSTSPTTTSTGTARSTAYVAIKARVFAYQRADDLLVANLDDPVVARARAAPRRRTVGVALGPARPGVTGRLGAPGHADGVGLARSSRSPRCARRRTTSPTRSRPPRPRVALGATPAAMRRGAGGFREAPPPSGVGR